MKKIFITWHYSAHGTGYLKEILNAFKEKGEAFDEIFYLSQPQESYKTFSEIHNVKYEKLKVKLLNDEDMVRWRKKYFRKENEYIINVSIENVKEVHVLIFAFFFMEEKFKNVKFVKYENSTISRLTMDEFSKYMNSRCPEISVIFAVLALTVLAWILYSDEKHIKDQISTYSKTGFSILLLGERGTGKSQLASEMTKGITANSKFICANCASFADDTMAEADLFGYKRGAFTGANKDTKGLFLEADGGILFLDEIHYLSKQVQAKLMRALQTNKDNKMSVRRLGDSKEEHVEFRLIVATNKTIDELREILLPDFFDRIVQHVVELPPLRNKREKMEQHWKNIWKQLRFEEPVPKDKLLIDWLKSDEQNLWGNYRDLQKIAIYYHTYNLFENKSIFAKNAVEYAKSEFEKYGAKSPEQENEKYGIDMKSYLQKTSNEIHKDFNFNLQEWAIKQYESRQKAAKILGVREKTLNNWKNRKTQ